MNLIISFSAREEGNCGRIAAYIAQTGDEIVHFAGLHARSCSSCAYECFGGCESSAYMVPKRKRRISCPA